jgi:hypothetical protein
MQSPWTFDEELMTNRFNYDEDREDYFVDRDIDQYLEDDDDE